MFAPARGSPSALDRADAVDVAQRNFNALFAGRYFHTNDACHKFLILTLTLFVAFVRANDADDASRFTILQFSHIFLLMLELS